MNYTENFGLTQYEENEKFRITQSTGSFNHDMGIIDDALKTHEDNAVDAYDPTSTYAVGALCIHESKLKRCTTAIETAEAWNDDHWEDTTIAAEIAREASARASADTSLGNAIAAKADTTMVDAIQDGLGIVANGNTHAAIAAGQFVFVKNHDTLATGLYTANSAIAANATLTSSNLTADPNGGLNALNSNLSTKLSYARVTDISANNIDSYMTTGIYQAWMANDLQSGVGSAWGILIVLHGTSVVCEQIMITVSGISVRHYENGVWGSWRKASFLAV